jgi:hypothetical protein
MCTVGWFLEVEVAFRECDHSPASSTEDMNAPMRAFMALCLFKDREFTFTSYTNISSLSTTEGK